MVRSPWATSAISPAPLVVASRSDETATRSPVKSASALHEETVGAHAAVDANLLEDVPGLSLGGVDEVGTAMGDAFEDRAHQVGLRRTPGDAEEAAAGAEVPLRRTETRERGHERDAVARRHRRRESLGLVGAAR